MKAYKKIKSRTKFSQLHKNVIQELQQGKKLFGLINSADQKTSVKI